MKYLIQKRRTGKTTNLINLLIAEMSKHPNYTFLFYSINACALPDCIKKNPRIKVNPQNLRGYEQDKVYLFVDDANINGNFLMNMKNIFSTYSLLKEKSCFTLDEECYPNDFMVAITES